MEKENIYIDLSKCSEEQIKAIPQILEKAGEKLSNNFKKGIEKDFEYLKFRFDNGINAWCVSGFKGVRTELTYPEFIKLFEGVEEENKGWIKVNESIPNRNDVVLVLTDYGKMDVCRFKEKYHWLNDIRPQHSNGSVIAWMPLPELPKF